MERLRKEMEEESARLAGAEVRKRDVLLAAAKHKNDCNNNAEVVPPSQVVRSDAVLPTLVEGDIGSLEASTSSFDSNVWAV